MDELRAFLNSLTPAEQGVFAVRCDTTIGYLRKALSKGATLGEGLCINIERESEQRVTCESLRPHGVDWAYIRGTPARPAANDSAPAPLAAGGAHA